MNKEHLIQQLKYTKEKHKNDKLHTFDTDISTMCSDVLDVLSRCIEIPDNATNGDVITEILKSSNDMHSIRYIGLAQEDTIYIEVGSNWWNAPYQVNKI